MKTSRFACASGLLLAALVAAPAATPRAPEAAVVRDLAAQPPDVALLHSGHQSAGIHPVYFGQELATGDFNGDGKTDLAVAAEYNSIGGDRSPGRGRVFVYFGRGAAFPAMIDPAEEGADCAIAGAATFEYFGTELVAGDFDGDGKDDLAVTSMGLSEVYRGRVYVIPGAVIAANTELRMDAGGYASRISGRSNKINGYYSYFGFSLAAGDFNGDGLDDLAAGAFGATGPGDARRDGGEVTVFLGRKSWRAELVAAEGQADMIIYGGGKNYALGTELAAADFDGDGRDELLAAAWGGDGPAHDRPYAGEVDVFDFATRSGVRFARGAGKKGRAWDLATKPPSGVVYGPATNARAGSSSSDGGGRSVAVGDYDGDGAPDVLIGSGFWGEPSPLRNPGKAWVVWGGPALARGAAVDLAAPGADSAVLAEGTGGDSLGDAVHLADLDGDGRAEALLGAPDADEARGYALIFRGRARPAPGAPAAGTADAVILGRRKVWRAAESIVVLDETFAGRTLVALGTPYGGFVNIYVPRGYAGQVDMVEAGALLQ